MFGKIRHSLKNRPLIRAGVILYLIFSITAASFTYGAQTVYAAESDSQIQNRLITSHNRDYSFEVRSDACETVNNDNTVSVLLSGKTSGYKAACEMKVSLYHKSADIMTDSWERVLLKDDTVTRVTESDPFVISGRTFYEVKVIYEDGSNQIIDVLSLSKEVSAGFSVRCSENSGNIYDSILNDLDLALSTFKLLSAAEKDAQKETVSSELISLAKDYLYYYNYTVENIIPNVSSGEWGYVDALVYGYKLAKFYSAYTSFKDYYNDNLPESDKEYYRAVNDSVSTDVLASILYYVNEHTKWF